MEIIKNLDSRKMKILEAIVQDYIQTAEPIGSRTIAKKYALGISSATIRNEMSDLEDMGLIFQPHTSSGRIPSDRGYRLYVDSLMHSHSLTQDENLFLQGVIINNIHHVDYLMKETAEAIAALTKCAAVVSEAKDTRTKIKHLQLLPMDEKSLVVVWVTDTKAVKNKLLFVQEPPGYDRMVQLSKILTASLQGKTVADINKQLIEKLLLDFAENAPLLMPILGVIADGLKGENQFYKSGVNNFLHFPEFSERTKAQAIFEVLERHELLRDLFEATLENSENVQILIGTENPVEPLQKCSVVKARYSIGEAGSGYIGIIGPTRMDYAQVVSVMHGILGNIGSVIKALTGT